MDVCFIDEDFTIEVIEDPEQSCDDEYLRNLLEEEGKKSTNRISEETSKKNDDIEKVAVQRTVKAKPEDEKITENQKEVSDKKRKSSKNYQCEKCGYYTTVLTTYYLHIRDHLDPSCRLLKCKKCSFSTFSKGSLSLHMNQHVPKEKLVRCHLCDYTTVKYRNLTAHLKNTHKDGKRKQYKCLRCSFITENKEDLDEHRNEVHNRNLRCQLCGFWASTKEEKDEHMREHRSERKKKRFAKQKKCKIHKCDCCDYESKYLSNVVQHRTKHVVEMTKE